MKTTLIAAWLLALSLTANAQPSQRETHAELPGVRLWYTDTGGTGEAVVFLHANTGSSRVWEYQIPAHSWHAATLKAAYLEKKKKR